MAFEITLDGKSGIPYYRQIVNQVVYGIVNDILKPGEQLPTVRQLAVNLKVNFNTISKAYKELEIKGIVATQQGTGTFISDKKLHIKATEKDNYLKNRCINFINEISSIGINLNDAIRMLQNIEAEKELPDEKENS